MVSGNSFAVGQASEDLAGVGIVVEDRARVCCGRSNKKVAEDLQIMPSIVAR